MSNQFYKTPLPHIDLASITGKLIVLEGADGSGRSTQIQLLTPWLENLGFSVVNIGLKRSTLVAKELAEAQQGNTLSRTTISLFYATDFADQLENTIIPALAAGSIVLCDRYIYTLMARDICRGASRDWVENLYGFAMIPDAVFYLQVSPQILIERNLEKNFRLNYWESGMDLGLSSSMFDSFLAYQNLMIGEFLRMKQKYHFHLVEGNRSPKSMSRRLQKQITPLLGVRSS